MPSPSGRSGGLDEEISDTFELGGRYQGSQSVYAEVVGFYTFFSDLIVEDSISGGPGSEGNVGEVESLGLELLVGADLGEIAGLPFGIPVRATATYTDATIVSTSDSSDAESIFAVGEEGNRVPYIPEWQVNLSAGIEFDRFRAFANLTWVDTRFADARNSSAQVDANGTPDSRFGQLDAFTTIDLSAEYDVSDKLHVFGRVTNLFDETYVTSRLPLGPRAGAPRLISGGVRVTF